MSGLCDIHVFRRANISDDDMVRDLCAYVPEMTEPMARECVREVGTTDAVCVFVGPPQNAGPILEGLEALGYGYRYSLLWKAYPRRIKREDFRELMSRTGPFRVARIDQKSEQEESFLYSDKRYQFCFTAKTAPFDPIEGAFIIRVSLLSGEQFAGSRPKPTERIPYIEENIGLFLHKYGLITIKRRFFMEAFTCLIEFQ